ncbi:MAG TPA: ABC transporter permease [Clostridia bacterium]|nr:ABC transporter permease [Clostridia bacterium]
MKVLDKRLFRTLKNAKAQYGAVVIIICIGLATLIGLSNTAQNMDNSLNEYYHSYQFADLFAEFTPVPVNVVADLKKIREIEKVEARIVTDVRVDIGREPYPVLRLVSIIPHQEINRLYVQKGRIPQIGDERGIALLNVFAEANNLVVGDEITLIIRGEVFPVTIMGIVDSPEYIYAIQDIKNMLPDNLNFGVGFINLSLLQEITGLSGQINNVVFTLSPGVDEKNIRDKIKEDFKGYGLKNIVTRDDHVSHALMDMEIEQLKRMSQVVPFMFLGIAVLVIYMLVSRLVQTDRVIIGILKATGYNNYEVMAHYLKLSLILGLTGAFLGVGMGYLMANFVTRLMITYFHLPLLEIQFSYQLVIIGFLLITLFCSTAGLMAVRKIVNIVPAEAMCPVVVSSGKKGLLEQWVPKLWIRITFSWKLVLRGIGRNLRRFALSVMGVALTYGIILFALYFFNVWNVVINAQFGEMENYDYTVSFIQPVNSEIITEMCSLSSITVIEPYMELPFRVVSGWREQTILARALSKTTELYQFRNEAGKIVSLPTKGVFLSQGFAKSLGIVEGDLVALSSYATKGQTFLVPVKAIVDQYLGSGLYLSWEQLECLTGQKGVFSGVVLNSSADIKRVFQNMPNIESIHSSADLVDIFTEYWGMIIASMGFIVFLGGLLGFAILYNTISVSLSERRRELSSLRILGFSQKEIFRLIIRENMLALLVGILSGIPLGKIMIVGLMNAILTGSTGEMFYFPTAITPITYLLTAVFVFGFMCFTLFVIRRKVYNLDFLEALSSRFT